MRLLLGVTTLWIAACVATHAFSQTPVPLGEGSYASALPPELENITRIERQKLNLVEERDEATPTNQWWTQLLFNQYAKSLWAFPFKVDTSEGGIDIFFPTRWNNTGSDPLSEFPLSIGAAHFRAPNASVKSWSDWTVTFRMAQQPQRYMDVTLGRGMPCLWIESQGLDLEISLPGKDEPKYFDASGKPMSQADTGECLGVTIAQRSFGLLAPPATSFTESSGKLKIRFAAKEQFLVVCALPSPDQMPLFYANAYAVPRKTTYTWKYDQRRGLVTTQWNVDTEPLKAGHDRVIQGWLPHHYVKSEQSIEFVKPEYLSPRGKLRCAVGTSFQIGFHFDGFVPTLPAPKTIGGENDFSPKRMGDYLATLADKLKFGSDTYWGGKDLLRAAQCTMMTQQLGDARSGLFRDALRGALVNWYTCTPGENDKYFVYYPKLRGLVGIKPGYGSEAFNDHHFHYGYFTYATAILMAQDAEFTREYREMAKLVSKDYANFDRDDKRFPFLRTFDVWEGHSWAGGTSSQGGNNQESSSEAVQGWAGLLLLGRVLNDEKMIAAGAMGYAVETRAAMEYWFNESGAVFPPQWKHPVTGMVWSGGKAYATYFSGDPAWIYGIQWLPATPAIHYLVRDPAFARKLYDNMREDYQRNEAREAAQTPKPGKAPHLARPPTIESFGSALGSVMLGYVLMYDPQWAAQRIDELWATPKPDIASNAGEMTTIYYQTHSLRSNGLTDWSVRSDCPTAMTFCDSQKKRTFAVWNPTDLQETVTFRDRSGVLGTLTAPPRAMTVSQSLDPAR